MEIVTKYLEEIGNYKLLPREVIVELIREAQKGNNKSKQIVVNHNLRLVISIVNKMRNSYISVPMEDKIQFGNLGLLHAIDKYDPDKINPVNGQPYAFSTYATWWIRQSIDRECLNTGREIRVPIHILKTYPAFKRVEQHLHRMGIHNPTDKDFEPYFSEDFGSKQYSSYINLPNTTSASMHNDSDDDGFIYDFMPDENSDILGKLVNSDLKAALSKLLMDLTEKERSIIQHRFGLDDNAAETLEEVGDRLGITRERVRQIQVNALKKLKLALTRAGLSQDILNDYQT